MGVSLENLSLKELPKKTIFNNRFVVEICENVHVHYRNLRLNLSIPDWRSIAEGFRGSLQRWIARGEPQTGEKHIELTRKRVGLNDENRTVMINLNKNLYLQNEGKIFSEGADLKDETYIHFKVGDIRLEFTKEEFLIIADAVKEAKKRLEHSHTYTSVR